MLTSGGRALKSSGGGGEEDQRKRKGRSSEGKMSTEGRLDIIEENVMNGGEGRKFSIRGGSFAQL